MFVTGRLVIFAAVGIAVVVGTGVMLPASEQAPWFAVLGWVLLGTLLVVSDLATAASPRDVRLDREMPARARLDEQVETTLHVTNLGHRSLRGMLRDGWQPSAGAGTARAGIDVPPGERRRVNIVLLPRRRGERSSGFVAIRSVGRLGLAGRQAVLAVPGAIRVLPPFRSRRHLPSLVARLQELDGATSVQVRGRGTEFDSMREYVQGDDVRSIDWRASARARKTMLRTWRPERDRHIVIVVDTGRTSAARVGDETRLDAAIEATLLLAALADRAGDNVHVLAFDRLARARVTGSHGASLLASIASAFASVEPQLIDTGWDEALAEAARFTTRPSLVVVVTAADSPAQARGLLEALPGITRRTRVLVASSRDIGLDALLGGPVDSEELWLATSAQQSVLEAERTAAALGQLGASALSADPLELPRLVSERYLELKRTGQL